MFFHECKKCLILVDLAKAGFPLGRIAAQMASLPTDYLGQNDSYWKRKRHAVSKVAVSYANGYDKAIRLGPGLS
ncbi:hypothetical protein CWM47_35505 [Spirosoma pollinicola]|uniref:Uncharacterized protein n=1 Tax=Spirosoma pollinicola TaxID=2057025 RepID=A0A2K8ZA07_9BACT|nr:hypothetical protein CWM47_35505 [Spirosoma pollinicola]